VAGALGAPAKLLSRPQRTGSSCSGEKNVIALRRYREGDLGLLRRLNAPEMMTYLGGPESDEQLTRRHARYVGHAEGMMARVFVIESDGVPVGSIAYWEREWSGADVYECGWAVLPEHQGKGIATVALRLMLEDARLLERRRYVHAFPKLENAASNTICRKTGFELMGACDFEYPKGNPIRCNDWRFDLGQAAAPRQ
jgi:RimJ/RimL family protein N-acetyltransferase